MVKILPSGDVRLYATLGGPFGPFSERSLSDGRDGFLYGAVSPGAARLPDQLGLVFRVPGPGPMAPSNFRIVR